MKTIPFAYFLDENTFIPSEYDNHIKRHLSNMAGQFVDEQAYQEQLDKEDLLLYEVYEIKRPEIEGELLAQRAFHGDGGLTVIHS